LLMKLKKIKIRGFKSFSSTQQLDIENIDSGVVFVTGLNSIEPKLGANGSGKSSLFEALSYCFYGKTSTNLKAGDIKNWNSNEPTEVSVEFDKTGTHTLKRTWNPNSLTYDGRVVTQDFVDRILGMNFDSFSYSILISQFGQKFLDFTPSEKLGVFTNILDDTLKGWDKYIDYCSNKVKALQVDKLNLTSEIANLDGKMESLETQNFEKEADIWEEEKKVKIKNLDSKITELNKETLDFSTEKKDSKYEILKGIEKALKSSTECYENSTQNVKETVKVVTELQTRKKLMLEQIEKMNTVAGLGTCPTCIQPVSSSVVKKEISKLMRERKDISLTLGKKEELLKIFELEVETYRKKRIELKDKKVTVEKIIKNIEQAEFRKDFLKKEIDSLTENMKKIKEETNPYKNIGTDNKSKVKVLKRRIMYKTDELEEVTKTSEIYQYWTKGFKDIKLMLTSEALEEFEIEINNNMQNLGLEDWKVKLMVDTETKSGSLKRGFSVFIKSPINDNLVPLDCWSGGEGQRVRIATTLGLVDFISGRRGTDWDILVLDEPTQFLSEQGISDLLKVLREKAVDKNIKIFLIDHRDLNTYGIFSGKVNIVKTEKGSIIS